MKYFVRIGLLFGLLSAANLGHAQRWLSSSELEFGIIAGASHYQGDLTQKTFEPKGLKPSFGLITRFTPYERFTFRLSGQWGGLEGNDEWYPDMDSVYERNLSFKSVLWDFTAAAEWNLRSLKYKQTSGVIPFLFAGISVFRFNPKAQFIYRDDSPHLGVNGYDYSSLKDRDGDWIELQPQGTEGQETTQENDRRRYSLTQLAIPIGAGLKFKLNPRWAMSLEYGLRYTFTDYIDDVSLTYVEPEFIAAQYTVMAAAMADRNRSLELYDAGRKRGTLHGDNQKNYNDIYGILGLTFTYRILGSDDQCASF